MNRLKEGDVRCDARVLYALMIIHDVTFSVP